MNLKTLSLHRKKASLLMRKRRQLERITMGRAPMVIRLVHAEEAQTRRPLAHYLSASIQGKSRHRYVRKAEVEYWRKRALAWQDFMKAMASWVKVNREIEKELRAIGRLRCDPLPGGRTDA